MRRGFAVHPALDFHLGTDSNIAGSTRVRFNSLFSGFATAKRRELQNPHRE
jgi:hypothetical protein